MSLLTLVVFALAMCLLHLQAAEAESVHFEQIEWTDIWIVNAHLNDRPRVLFIGDSIVRGYFASVEKLLGDRANCGRYTTSKCVTDPDFRAELSVLLKRYEFDVIQLNNGLHGWSYSEAEYATGLRELLDLLRREAPGATLVWAASTPVRQAGQVNELVIERNDRVIERNRLAAELMKPRQIAINDLYAASIDHPEHFSQDGVHFNDEGKSEQAKATAEMVAKLLPGADGSD